MNPPDPTNLTDMARARSSFEDKVHYGTIHSTIAIKYLDIIFPLSYFLLFVAKVWPWFATRGGDPNLVIKVGVLFDSNKLDMIFLCLSAKKVCDDVFHPKNGQKYIFFVYLPLIHVS